MISEWVEDANAFVQENPTLNRAELADMSTGAVNWSMSQMVWRILHLVHGDMDGVHSYLISDGSSIKAN